MTEKRTFDGLEGSGYRFTALFTDRGRNSARFAMEFWLSGPLPGDEEIRTLNRRAAEVLNDPKGYPTTSMWINEFFPVLYETLPEELQQAL